MEAAADILAGSKSSAPAMPTQKLEGEVVDLGGPTNQNYKSTDDSAKIDTTKAAKSATAPTTPGGVQATGTTSLGLALLPTIAGGGTGYTVGDTLTFSGGTFTTAATLTVTTVSGGVITGVLQANPNNPSLVGTNIDLTITSVPASKAQAYYVLVNDDPDLKPIRISLPKPPSKVSLPTPPVRVLMALLPMMILSKVLPVPLMADDPNRVKFSRGTILKKKPLLKRLITRKFSSSFIRFFY